MIAYLKGRLVKKGMTDILIEVAGIGYQVLVSAATMAKLPETGEDTQVFTYMSVKEDSMTLFGFATGQEQEMFLKLLTVNGIGPKGALGFLAQLSPQEIVMAILTDDIKTLSKAPGVGKKTAQRVVLELKDKCGTMEGIVNVIDEASDVADMGGAKFEAIEAMTALGYSRTEAAKAVQGVATEGMTTEEILKAALKKMITF